MSRLAELTAFPHLLAFKAGTVLAFVRGIGANWFPRRYPFSPQVPLFDPRALVALADQEAAAGHADRAAHLLDAAYIVFDCAMEMRGGI